MVPDHLLYHLKQHNLQGVCGYYGNKVIKLIRLDKWEYLNNHGQTQHLQPPTTARDCWYTPSSFPCYTTTMDTSNLYMLVKISTTFSLFY